MGDVFAPFSLSGKVALVTGASGGLGLHFAEVLAQAGAKVVLAARRTELLQEACEKIQAEGGEACAVTMDVTDSDSIKNAFDAAEKQFGLITVVVNNAGISKPKLLVDMKDEDWDSIINTNLNSAAYVTRESAKRLINADSKGSIINITSITAERVQHYLTSYSAAKAGLVHFTKAAALEFAQQGIRVNAISPGYFNTPLLRGWFESEDGQAMVNRVPTQRIGEFEDLNGPLLLLASDASAHMTGTVITVDGGHVLTAL